MELHDVLKGKFGYEQFRKGQEPIIRRLLRGENQIAILPTGGGKSLCYQLPAYLVDGLVVIISPLVALMEDQVAQLKKQGEKRVAALNSFNNWQQRRLILSNLPHYKFLFISPEMLMSEQLQKQLANVHIAYLVVDEAHCISQWGFDFRPDYLRLQTFFKQRPNCPVLALTATADEKVIEDIQFYLNLSTVHVEKTSLNRQNISYELIKMTDEEEKTKWLVEHLKQTTGPGVIYVGSRKRADELAALLSKHCSGIQSYHAGLEKEDRALIQAQFISGEVNWICATNAFGMGIHKDDVRQVIHEHIPASMANYIQEVGRAGRDGKRAHATMIFVEEDLQKTRFIMLEDFPTAAIVRDIGQQMKYQSLKEVADFFALNETMTRVLHYYLSHYSIEEAVLKIEEQRQAKEQHFKKMTTFIETSHCLRQEVLKNFGEHDFTKSENCCSNCGLQPLTFLNQQNTMENCAQRIDWQERLSQLLGDA